MRDLNKFSKATMWEARSRKPIDPQRLLKGDSFQVISVPTDYYGDATHPYVIHGMHEVVSDGARSRRLTAVAKRHQELIDAGLARREDLDAWSKMDAERTMAPPQPGEIREVYANNRYAKQLYGKGE